MIRDYFEYNGKKYYSGTVIRVSPIFEHYSWITENNAVFLGYYVECNRYIIRGGNNQDCYLPEDKFYNILIGVTDDVDDKCKCFAQEKNMALNRKATFFDELNIDGMIVAWMWYIFIMAVAVIFNERIGIWIFASIVFFRYRKKKLKERGYR